MSSSNPSSSSKIQLHNAVYRGKAHVVKTLLKSTSDPNIPCGNYPDVSDSRIVGLTPLQIAILNADTKIVEVLLRDDRVDIEIPYSDGLTPLLVAVGPATSQERSLKLDTICSFLLDCDARLFPKKQLSALHQSASWGRAECLSMLLDKAPTYVNHTILPCLSTPLHFAAAIGSDACIILLLSRGASILPNGKSETPNDVINRILKGHITPAKRQRLEACLNILVASEFDLEITNYSDDILSDDDEYIDFPGMNALDNLNLTDKNSPPKPKTVKEPTVPSKKIKSSVSLTSFRHLSLKSKHFSSPPIHSKASHSSFSPSRTHKKRRSNSDIVSRTLSKQTSHSRLSSSSNKPFKFSMVSPRSSMTSPRSTPKPFQLSKSMSLSALPLGGSGSPRKHKKIQRKSSQGFFSKFRKSKSKKKLKKVTDDFIIDDDDDFSALGGFSPAGAGSSTSSSSSTYLFTKEFP